VQGGTHVAYGLAEKGVESVHIERTRLGLSCHESSPLGLKSHFCVAKTAIGFRTGSVGSQSDDCRGIAGLDLRLYGDTVTQRLHDDATVFRGGKKHPYRVFIDVVLCLKLYTTTHPLESHWNRAFYQQATAHVAFCSDSHFQGLQANATMIGDHPQRRVEASCQCRAEQIARIRVVVKTTHGPMNPELHGCVGAIGRHDDAVERIPPARAYRLRPVADPGVGRNAAVMLAQRVLPLLYKA
jgi:hypothetical protein